MSSRSHTPERVAQHDIANMKCETDIKRVRKLAARKEKANWEFRTFLKGVELSIEEMDGIVHRHYDEVRKEVDCRSCGNCCREITPSLSKSDLKRLSSGLHISQDDLVNRYLVPGEDAGTYAFNRTPCPFLTGNDCSVYEHRPSVCRSYPHLHKKEFVFRLIGVVHNCSVCPIVYNVFERLKDELWQDPDDAWHEE
jgi:hypothetical protein